MKNTISINLNLKFILVTTLILITMASNIQAKNKEFAYQGKIEGMVCAFCVYNVSNKIRELPGVQKNSVNVELKSGKVEFLSSQLVSQKIVAKLFEDSGFKLISLNKINNALLATIDFSKIAKISISFPINELSFMDELLSDLGDLAEKEMSLVTINAPKSIEMAILKPIIAGRQQTIKVKFTEKQTQQVEINIYSKAKTYFKNAANEQHAN